MGSVGGARPRPSDGYSVFIGTLADGANVPPLSLTGRIGRKTSSAPSGQRVRAPDSTGFASPGCRRAALHPWLHPDTPVEVKMWVTARSRAVARRDASTSARAIGKRRGSRAVAHGWVAERAVARRDASKSARAIGGRHGSRAVAHGWIAERAVAHGGMSESAAARGEVHESAVAGRSVSETATGPG